MPRPNFKKAREILATSAKKALREFAKSEDNKAVYAVVFDLMEEYGTAILSLNTESRLEERRNDTYPHYTDDQVNGMSGLKYNSGDFSFIDVGDVRKGLEQWAGSFEEYLSSLKSDGAREKNIERFSDAVADAILELRDDFRLLDTTSDFVAYHCFHDASEETVERLIRKTTDEATFDKIFPEVKRSRELLESITGLSEGRQAALWIECLESFAFATPSAFAAEYFKTHLPLDVKGQLAPLGSAAIPQILKLLDRVVLEPQFSIKGSEEYKSQGAFTRCCSVTTDLLRAMRKIGYADETVEQKLTSYAKRLMEQIEGDGSTIGINLRWVANTLYSLFPERYPEPLMSFGNNRVENISTYIKEN